MDARVDPVLLAESAVPDPPHYIASEPAGRGVVCALFYVERGGEVYGWWTGACREGRHSAYFRVENFSGSRPRRLYVTAGLDLDKGWALLQAPRRASALAAPKPIAEDLARELEGLRGRFAAEWLFGAEDPGAGADRFAYERLGLAVNAVNVRSRQLGKFDRRGPVWIRHTRGFNGALMNYLRHCWPLDYPGRLRAASPRPERAAPVSAARSPSRPALPVLDMDQPDPTRQRLS